MEDTNPIFQSLAVIEENIREKLTVESLAGSIHVSRYHYQRMFQKAVGDSVMRYVTRRRLSLAAAELAATDASILEIALKYGYDSHEGFTRSFRAYMGVSPKEYRKYHVSVSLPATQKEGSAMFYSKTTDGMIRELNQLIVQAKETAAYAKRCREQRGEAMAAYAGFLDTAAASADAMADGLGVVLGRVTAIPKRPDGISARFMLMKAIEDATFQSHVTAFQIRLMAARAKPEHRAAFEPICAKYEELAQNAQIKAGRMAGFFNELSALIFQDMRENALQKLQEAAAKGTAAAKALEDAKDFPYAYLADEIRKIAQELSLDGGEEELADVSVSSLEDALLWLDLVASAAELDMLRMPSHKPLLDGIRGFREQLEETALFFQNLPQDAAREIAMQEKGAVLERTMDKKYSDLAFQGNILLFYLKGEIQKLGQRMEEGQKAAFAHICDRMREAIRLARCAKDGESMGEMAGIFRQVHGKLEEEAGRLGAYGGPVRFLAKEILRLGDSCV